MKRIITSIIALSSLCALSSQELGLSITPIMPNTEVISNEASEYLQGQLEDLLTDNNIISGISDRFIITAKIRQEQKSVSPTNPVKIILKYRVTVFVGDVINDKVYGKHTVSVSGIGETETKSEINAFLKINSNNEALSNLVIDAKNEIINYYNDNCDRIITQADENERRGDYDAAIVLLAGIPEQCVTCYEKSWDKLNHILQQKSDMFCKQHLREAESVWTVHNDYEHAQKALDILLDIAPYSSCIDKANDLYVKIDDVLRKKENDTEKRRLERERREWEYKVKVHNDNVEIRKHLISAVKDVASSIGHGLARRTTNIINKW